MLQDVSVSMQWISGPFSQETGRYKQTKVLSDKYIILNTPYIHVCACACISFRPPAVGHVEASGAQRNPKLHDGHNGIAEQQEPQAKECEEQEAIVQILPSELVSSSVSSA